MPPTRRFVRRLVKKTAYLLFSSEYTENQYVPILFLYRFWDKNGTFERFFAQMPKIRHPLNIVKAFSQRAHRPNELLVMENPAKYVVNICL